MANQSPSINPADYGTLTGAIKIAVDKAMQGMDVMMPVEVVAYDRATNRATVKHLIQMQGTNGEKVDRANVSSVRVYQFGNAAFSMSLPIKPGDKGWIMAADRDISIFQQGLQKDAPNTRRMHSFQDGLFMPDSMNMGNVQAADEENVTIQLHDGGARISLGANIVTLTVGGNSISIGPAGVTITGPLQINGPTARHNSKNIGDDHKHSGVQSGPTNTGNPI